MSLLKVENLHVYYGNIHAVKGVSLYVEEGEVVTLIGANGAGKTTTLQTISGLLPSKEGKVFFQEQDITKEKPHRITKEGIAQVPEGRRVFKGLSVYDNLQLGAYTKKDTAESMKEKIKKVYERFPRMEERKDQKAGTLSGGEQQMLAMGRAMMSEPKLLLLDEPSMGLSPLFVEEIFDVIKSLNRDGVTILLVEQNAGVALQVAHRGYILETGKIVGEGPAEVLAKDKKIKEAYLGG